MTQTFGEFWKAYITEHPEDETVKNIKLAGAAFQAGMEMAFEVINTRIRDMEWR